MEMLLKVVVGLIVIVCIVKWIIRGLTALGSALAQGFLAALPGLLWSLAGLASLVTVGALIRAVVHLVRRPSGAPRLTATLTVDADDSIAPRSAAPTVHLGPHAGTEPL